MSILALSVPRRFLLAVACAISLTGAACSSTPAPDPAPPGPPASSAAPTGSDLAAPAPVNPAPTTTAAEPAPTAPAASTAAPTAAPTATASASAAPQTPPGPSYVACGCGCCGGVTPRTQCLYRSKGDNLDKIIAADKAGRDPRKCANVGCSIGTEYRYCD